MIKVVCANSETDLPVPSDNVIPVLLYDNASTYGTGVIGARVPNTFIKKLAASPSTNAVDFLSLALAVTAADTFVRRDIFPNRWHREIHLVVEMANPDVWIPLKQILEQALDFISGDRWEIEFKPNGYSPAPIERKTDAPDCVCMFSGGMDSAIGAVDLVSNGKKPLLVSHAYRGDQSYQQHLLDLMGNKKPYSISANAHAHRIQDENEDPIIYDTNMRARSILFLGLGVVAASASIERSGLRAIDLIVPENGFISVNPPLTPRRTGSHSTRTTHPYFLDLMQQVLHGIGLDINLVNPYQDKTKGEMIKQCGDPTLIHTILDKTVSCGKWKRKNQQCGKCVPCLIRRAAFHSAGINDGTTKGYQYNSLQAVLGDVDKHDDLLAMLIAISKHEQTDVKRWAISNGPLPSDPVQRNQRIRAVKEGLKEVASFLRANGCHP